MLKKLIQNIFNLSSLWIPTEVTSELGYWKLRVKLGGRNNPSIQSSSRSINLFSIQECIFGIRRIQGKLRSTVWTVYHKLPAPRAFHVSYQPDQATYCVGSKVYVWNVFGYFPPPSLSMGQVYLSPFYSDPFRIWIVWNGRKGDVMALLSMFGESLHLCTVHSSNWKGKTFWSFFQYKCN